MKRILFVDDEPKVLQGLRRTLHSMRGEWQAEYVTNGPEALEIMARAPFDVIVSDLRMPSMDGVQLLNEVMKRHPNVVRVVLSATSDEQAILRYVGKTHLFLSKPCEADSLRSTVTRACALRDLLANPDLQRLISKIETLPSLPSLYLELREELRRDEPSMNRISSIVSKDMAMVARVLQLVNSAFFGFYGRVTSVERAVVLLGTRTIQSLVLSFKVFSQFDQSKVKAFRIDNLINHCVTTASFAKAICKAEGQPQEMMSDALTAGLLHDIGKLVLASSLPAKYLHVQSLVRDKKLLPWQAELEILGATHAELGAYLVGLWGLPDPVVEALAFHHSPEKSALRKFSPLTAVHVADVLEYQGKVAVADADPTPQADDWYLNTLRLTPRLPAWQALCQTAREERTAA